MSVNAKVLMCTAALCVAGVRAEGDNWEDTKQATATSDSTPEGTTEPIVPLGPVNGPVTPVPPKDNQIVVGADFTVQGNFSDCFYPNGTPKSALVYGMQGDITEGARKSNDTSLRKFTLIDSLTEGSAVVESRLIFSPDQFTGTPEEQIKAVQDMAASVESLSASEILGPQTGLMAATGATEKFTVTGLTFTREGTAAPSGASANGVAVMVGALFAALVAL